MEEFKSLKIDILIDPILSINTMTEITKHFIKIGDAYKCNLCEKITPYASTMHYHIATKHIEKKPYNCTIITIFLPEGLHYGKTLGT